VGLGVVPTMRILGCTFAGGVIAGSLYLGRLVTIQHQSLCISNIAASVALGLGAFAGGFAVLMWLTEVTRYIRHRGE